MTKYEFDDQMMIYTQSIAKAVASFATWRDVFGKVVKKILKVSTRYTDSGKKILHYVFDINDTVDIQAEKILKKMKYSEEKQKL